MREGRVSLISAALTYSMGGDSLLSIAEVESFILLEGDRGLVAPTDVEEDEFLPDILPLVDIKWVMEVEWLWGMYVCMVLLLCLEVPALLVLGISPPPSLVFNLTRLKSCSAFLHLKAYIPEKKKNMFHQLIFTQIFMTELT